MHDLEILLVDDSPSALELYKECLKPLKANLTTAANGKEGLEKALLMPFTLIITDVDMPEMDGISLCKSLKRFSQTRQIPLIIVSSFDSEKDIEKGFSAGATAYLSKSEVRSHMRTTVEETLWKDRNLRNRKILIVDDSRSIRDILKSGLKASGFNVVTASNGATALELLNRDRPDLILSDINMPGINGFELCKSVKGNADFSTLPFVVMSDNKNKSTMMRIIQYGASAYIVKPFNVDQLVILIERLLSQHFRTLLNEKERLVSERSIILDSIASLVSALEARDLYTKGHSIAVSRIASDMLELTGADSEDVHALKIGGRLHDIGKIGVMDSVLLKPGKLTDEEFEHIKQHPSIGRKILQPIPSLSNILGIVYHHHERWDGKGYPSGLKGKDIPLWARITAVADTFHALTSNRPYRKGMPAEKAFQIVQDVKEAQLCPQCVEMFFDWVQTKADNDSLY